MYKLNYQFLIKELKNLLSDAEKKALDFYYNGFSVEIKPDLSPVTEADKSLETLIRNGLKDITPNIPVIGEEGNKNADISKGIFWLLDPIDGTKEFIKHNGEFTINLALIVNKKPVFGIVCAPVLSEYYYNIEKKLAVFSNKIGENETLLKVRKIPQNPDERIILISRSIHREKEYLNLLHSLNYGKKIPLGSSLKICHIARGIADIYPLSPNTHEWDTAAAHAILNAAGVHIYNCKTKKELAYAKKNFLNPLLLASNFNFFN